MKQLPFPWWSVSLATCAVAVYLLPNLSAALIYDRSAILSGEFWRLITGHWVHFSASHLICDVIVFGFSGWLIESRGYRHFAVLCVCSALSISLVMLATLPDMARYGGLSGVAMSSIVYLALHGRREARSWRGVCVGILALSIGKLVMDVFAEHLHLVDFEDAAVVTVPTSHLVGAATGFVMYLWSVGRLPLSKRGWRNQESEDRRRRMDIELDGSVTEGK